MEKMTKPANMLVQELMQHTMMESLNEAGGWVRRLGTTTGQWDPRAVTSEGRERGSRRGTAGARPEQARQGREGKRGPLRRERETS